MKKNLKSILLKLEQLEENQMGQLQGGFASITITPDHGPLSATTNNCKGGLCGPTTNNCQGGNCSQTCGVIK